MFAEYSAGRNPHPRPFSHSANPHPSLSQWERSWEKGGRQAGLRVRSLVLVSRLRAALERLNLALPAEAITAAVDELTRDLLLPRLLSGQEALASKEQKCKAEPRA